MAKVKKAGTANGSTVAPKQIINGQATGIAAAEYDATLDKIDDCLAEVRWLYPKAFHEHEATRHAASEAKSPQGNIKRKEKRLESSLRATCKSLGYALQKSRVRNPRDPRFGTYRVTTLDLNQLVCGDSTSGFGWTLTEVAHFFSVKRIV